MIRHRTALMFLKDFRPLLLDKGYHFVENNLQFPRVHTIGHRQYLHVPRTRIICRQACETIG